MSLQIVEIRDQGKPDVERVVFLANAPLTLAYYLVMHSTAVGGLGLAGDGVASGAHPAFWFPTVQVVAGAQIQLFTGSWLNKQKVPTPLNFFWGLKQTIFNKPTDAVVLVQAANWQSIKAVGRAAIPPTPPGPMNLGNLMGGIKG